jgi:hypothetical protein
VTVPRRVRVWCFLSVAAACALSLLSACATGSLATSDTTPSGTARSSLATASVSGPTVIVTVPDLLLTTTAPVVPATESAAPQVIPPVADPVPAQTGTAAPDPGTPPVAETPAPDQPATEQPASEQPATTDAPPPAPAAAPSGAGLNVTLTNCDGCTVLATHRGVTGDLSAALVGTGSGRAVLLSVAADGRVAGVIGVPYGAAFDPPAGGVLPCAQSRCVVQGRQSDGRAILSAFELTGTGAWRDVSGDDAFPSATEQAAVIDLDGDIAIAVQDQANGAAVWMLYTWGGDRYSVVGCAADGPAPTSVGDVSPGVCLS